MKRTIYIIALLALVLASCSKAERNEKKYLKAMQSEDYEEATAGFNDFCSWLEKDKSTMTYDFKLMREAMDLKVATSADGKLRCYSWPTGGESESNRYYANLTQWLVDDNILAFRGPIDNLLAGRKPDISKEITLAHSIDTIIEIHAGPKGDKTAYLIAQSYVNSDGNKRSYVSASYINGIRLTLLPFFFDGIEFAGNNEFVNYENVKTSDLFKWDEKAKRFYAYQTDDSLHYLPGKYTIYQFDGNMMKKVEAE